MAASIVGSSSYAENNASTNFSRSETCPAEGTYMVLVGACGETPFANDLVRWNGVDLTLRLTESGGGGGGPAMKLWTLASPATGTNTLTYSSTSSVDVIYSIFWVTGVSSTDTIEDTEKSSGVSDSPQVASLVSGAVSDSIGMMGYGRDVADNAGTGSVSWGSGEIEIYDNTTANTMKMAAAYETYSTTGTKTITATDSVTSIASMHVAILLNGGLADTGRGARDLTLLDVG